MFHQDHIPPCADALELKVWRSGWPQERRSTYDPESFLQGYDEDGVLIESVDDSADDPYIEYEEGLTELAMKRCGSLKQENDKEQRC
ncbi:hypothetical protein BGZ96_012283, partial [Linnemannia gamsii]